MCSSVDLPRSSAGYYLPLFLGIDYKISKVISWVAAVVFAFFVNKHWVFLDKDYSAKALLRQGG